MDRLECGATPPPPLTNHKWGTGTTPWKWATEPGSKTISLAWTDRVPLTDDSLVIAGSSGRRYLGYRQDGI